MSFEVGRGELFGLIGPDGSRQDDAFPALRRSSHPTAAPPRSTGLNIVADYGSASASGRLHARTVFALSRLVGGENLAFFAALFGVEIAENYDLIAPIYRQIEPFRAPVRESFPEV